MTEIETRVMGVVRDCLDLGEEELSKNSAFTEDLGVDSLSLLELMLALQSEFNCQIPDEDARKIATVGQAVEYVQAHA